MFDIKKNPHIINPKMSANISLVNYHCIRSSFVLLFLLLRSSVTARCPFIATFLSLAYRALILLWQFEVILRHFRAHVALVKCHLFDDVEEGWYFNLWAFFSRLNPKKRGLPIDVHKGLHKEVLLLINETLSDFLEDLLVWCLGLLEKFNVLSCWNLSSLFDSFTTLIGAHFVTVGERVIFTSLT